MDDSIHSIIIFYSGKHTRYYLCLSTFFTLCGYMVVGRLEEVYRQMTDFSEMKDGNSCDLRIGLGDAGNHAVDIRISDPELVCATLLLNVLTEMKESGCITQEAFEALDNIRKLYKKYELRRTEYTGQYYFYVKDEVRGAHRKYYEACTELRYMQQNAIEGSAKDRFFWYVRGQFVRRMESLAAINKDPMPYNIPVMLEKLEGVISRHPDMYSIYELMGYLAETTKETRDSAEKYYKECIKLAPDARSTSLSEIYYRLAHWYEVRKRVADAYRYYLLSYETDVCNYRALYKLGRISEIQFRELGEAKKYFERIQYMLETIRDGKYIQPVEYEYLFKTYYCLAEIMEKEGRNKEKSEFESLMLGMKETSPMEMRFFKDFYEADAKKYFQYMVDRVGHYCSNL